MSQILAGQRAAFTKALTAHRQTEDEDKKRVAACKIAGTLNRAESKGFTRNQIIKGAEIPADVLGILKDGIIDVSQPLSEDPDQLVRELQQTVDSGSQRTLGSCSQCVYAYGYRCAPDRLKVGRTDGDVVTRIAGQISTGTPDKPTLSLVIRTDECRGLEMAIQGALRVRGRKVVGGGDEWYLTTSDEVIEIYLAISGRGSEEYPTATEPAARRFVPPLSVSPERNREIAPAV